MKRRIIGCVLAAVLLITMLPALAMPVAAENAFEMSDEFLEMLKEFEGFSAKHNTVTALFNPRHSYKNRFPRSRLLRSEENRKRRQAL